MNISWLSTFRSYKFGLPNPTGESQIEETMLTQWICTRNYQMNFWQGKGGENMLSSHVAKDMVM